MKKILLIRVWLLAGLLLLHLPAWADIQARLNVVASALEGAQGLSFESLAVGEFSDRDSGGQTAFSEKIKDGLRKALKRGKHWNLVGAEKSPADVTLSGSYSRDAAVIRLRVELKEKPDGEILWSRYVAIPESEIDTGDLGAVEHAAVNDESSDVPPPPMVIPRLKPRSKVPHHFHVDMSVAYKAFFPTNPTFQNAAGSRMDGLSLGLSFNDVVLLDADFWRQGVSSLGSVESLSYAGSSLAVTYPWRITPGLTLYGGPGLRMASLQVNDRDLDRYEERARFGNNGLDAVAGIKAKLGRVGIDARYSYDLLSSYTGYHTMRLGAFYEFGN